jgi:hypothetical protein
MGGVVIRRNSHGNHARDVGVADRAVTIIEAAVGKLAADKVVKRLVMVVISARAAPFDGSSAIIA